MWKRQFRSLWHLRNHSRDKHGRKEECSFYNENRCKFGSKCCKKHSPSQGNKSYTCFTCKETFQNMNTLMHHRKKRHEELCRPCEPKNGNCRYEDNPESCWFIHQDFFTGSEQDNSSLKSRDVDSIDIVKSVK